MCKMNERLPGHRVTQGMVLGYLLTLSATWAYAEPLAQLPLFVSGLGSVNPNIVMIIDDSGSMDSEVLLPTNDGALWWRTGDGHESFVGLDADDDPDTSGILNYNKAGGADSSWKKYVYLFPNGKGDGIRVYGDSSNDHYAIPPVDTFAYARSPDYNGMYYDTHETYEPWPSEGENTFVNATPASARSDAVTGSGTLNLTENQRSTTDNWKFRVQDGMVLPEGTVVYQNSSWQALSTDKAYTSSSSLGIEYYPATFYQKENGSYRETIDEGSYSVTNDVGERVSGDCETPNELHGSYYSARPGSFESGVATGLTNEGVCYLTHPNYLYRVKDKDGNLISGDCGSPSPAHYLGFAKYPSSFESDHVDALAYDGECLKRYEIKSGNSFPSGRSYADEIQNFANWFTYYRKRHLATRGGIGSAFTDLEGLNIGAFTINNRTLKGMWDYDLDNDRAALFNYIYGRDGNSGGTPNRLALEYAGDQFDTNEDIIEYPCQQNFALLFTDGFSNVDDTNVGNTDGTSGVPYADSYSNTIADIAMKYYANPLREADFDEGEAPVPGVCSSERVSPWQDCNEDLHLVTFGVTLGAQGHIFGNTHHSVQDAYEDNPTWQNPTQVRNPVQVDDLYHATVNSRGEMLNAKTATELQQALKGALQLIVKRTVSTGASVSASSTRTRGDTMIYQAKFNTTDWSGDLIALNLFDEEADDSHVWHAAAALTENWADRNLFTWNPTTKAGISFEWSSLTDTQKADLNDRNVLEWLRGDTSLPGSYRLRDTILGDIVNSDPLYVGKPQNLGYGGLPEAALERNSYTGEGGFLATYKNRTPMVYVGANDGMLHGFSATTGEEIFAYVPNAVFPNLAGLASPDYSHQYFVDGSPSVGDAYVNSAWRSILIGSLGAGGRAVFALDVTDPAAGSGFSASNVLWEFTDEDLGYLVGQMTSSPVIGRLPSGDWAAIFGNGYDSGSGAFLYIVKLSDGSLIKKIEVSSDATNGLSAVAVIRDSQQTIAGGYAGDLKGNLWKFDLTGNQSNWSVAYGGPLFQATTSGGSPQPITSPLDVARHPLGGYLIYFGTGQYMREDDPANKAVQTAYGIWDNAVLGKDTTEEDANTVWKLPCDDAATNLQECIDSKVRITADTLSGTYGRDRLLEQDIIHELGVEADPDNYTWRVFSKNTIDWGTRSAPNDRGWCIDLISPVHGEEGERIFSRPQILSGSGLVLFTSVVPVEATNVCEAGGGTSWVFAVDMFSGGRADGVTFDVNGDGKFDDTDKKKVTIDGQEVMVPLSGFNVDEIIDSPRVLRTGEDYTLVIAGSGGGDAKEGPGIDGNLLGRQGWRQLR